MSDPLALRSTLGNVVLGVSLAAGTVAGATLETRAQPSVTLTDTQLLEDFAHYVMIANTELAEASARALLERGLDPATFVGIVEDSATMKDRFERAYGRALVMPGLEDEAAGLNGLYEEGRRRRARDPQEIDRNIGLLTGMTRGRILARDRLRFAGEYAVPQLLEVIRSRRDPLLAGEISGLLSSMGRQAVQPLCEALIGEDAATQEAIARILGRMQIPASLPYLVELHRATPSEAVRSSAARAIEQAGGSTSGDLSLGTLFRMLAENYYKEQSSLTAFPGEAHQLLWSFGRETGLQPQAIRTEVYHEAMAMRLAERSLRFDAGDQEAIALWLAANFSREIDQPEEYENPAYPAETRREAMYYAVAAGADLTQRVLARALADRDTPLARRAIEALSRSAGVSGLVGARGVPLVDALNYPDRRVRFEAALALGRAKPREVFPGAERVVPTLAGIISESSRRYGVVLATTIERQQGLREVLEGLGYIVLPPALGLDGVRDSIAEVAAVDLIVADQTTEGTLDTLAQARSDSRLLATPVLALMSATGIGQYGGQFDADRLTQILRQGVSDEQFAEGVRQLVERASGAPIDAEEAESYSSSALDVLQDLAIASGGSSAGSSLSALDVADAAVPLITALGETEGAIRFQVAEVLSFVGQPRAQVALMDAVMSADGPEGLVLMTKVIQSAKRFGNMLEDRQVRWLVDAADTTGDDDRATLSASLLGALNLPNTRLVPLILGPAR